MKLTLGLTAALLLCAATAHAQVPSFGIRAGVNVANLSFSDEADVTEPENLTGLVIGMFATVPVNGVVAFQPEVLFSQQGTRLRDSGDTAKIKIDYLQVPLLGRFGLVKGSAVAVLVGPTLGFRTSAKIEVPGAPPGFSDGFEDEIEKFDFGLVTGVGVNLGALVLDGRYTWGLMNVSKNDADNTGTAKNRVFSASVGIKF